MVSRMEEPAHETEVVIANVKRLLVLQLKYVLKQEGHRTSGSKAALQERTTSLMWQYFRDKRYYRYNRLAEMVSNPDRLNLGDRAPFQALTQRPYTVPSSPAQAAQIVPAVLPYRSDQAAYPTFKESPFYTVLQPLTPLPEFQASTREASKDQLHLKITIKNDVARQLQEPSIKAMIYCTSDTVRPVFPFSKVDVTFPKHVDMKVNGEEVKADWRGVNGKIGSTRPADITNLLITRLDYQNSMTIKFPPSIRNFYFAVNLVKKYTTEYLLNRVKFRNPISIDEVIQEMVKKGNDSEIIAISSIMTLQCPLSLSRINIPCRSTTYTHNQCFDALSFLQLQEQAPTWLCPICSRAIGFDELAIDQYVADILTNTDQEVERVTIRPDGTWYIEVASTSHGAEQASSGGLKKDSPYQSLATPPSSQSGEQSTSYFASAPVGRGKRPSAVIEISSDEDDEDELPLARKRLRLNTQSTGHSTWPFR